MTIISQPTKSEIFTVYNKLRAALRLTGNQKAIERINRALGILQSKALFEKLSEYRPTQGDCTCKDWEYRFARKRAYTGICKHSMVVIMLDLIGELRQAHDITHLVKVYSEVKCE